MSSYSSTLSVVWPGKKRKEKVKIDGSVTRTRDQPHEVNVLTTICKQLQILQNCYKILQKLLLPNQSSLQCGQKNVERFTILRVILAQGPC